MPLSREELATLKEYVAKANLGHWDYTVAARIFDKLEADMLNKPAPGPSMAQIKAKYLGVSVEEAAKTIPPATEGGRAERVGGKTVVYNEKGQVVARQG